MLTSRQAAYAALIAWGRSGEFVARTLDGSARELSPQDRRLAHELALGVVRRGATLDAILAPHVSRPRPRVEDELWTLLQLGAYQLVFLESIPPHAAVHETVELARAAGHARWVGFANAVLRRVAEDLTAEHADGPAADALPLADGRFRRLRRPAFPDPAADFRGYVAQACSLPRWLVARWSARFAPDELLRLGIWLNASPPLWLRVNPLRTTREDLLAALRQPGVEAVAGNRPESIRLGAGGGGERRQGDKETRRQGAPESGVVSAPLSPGLLVSLSPGLPSVEGLPGFAEGWFTVQDESAMEAAALLSPQPGDFVLDLCAAPGVKTTHLAERMQGRGRILAADVHPARLERIAANARRLGHTIIEPLLIREDGGDIPAGPFDAILADVPCSNTGVLGRRPEARWRLEPRDIDELARIQRRLLEAACRRLKPGGRLVYSTCSLEPEENSQLVRQLLAQRDDMSLEVEREHIPGRPADGGYQALLVRSTGFVPG